MPGADVAGVVEAVGPGVQDLSPGDRVFGDLSGSGFGAYAEFAKASSEGLARMPKNVDFRDMAAVPTAGQTALQALRDAGRLAAGQSVLVNGASGGVGCFAVQLAKILGARRIVAVCSGKSAGWVATLGPDKVIDYKVEDFAAGDEVFDIVLDAAASRPLSETKNALAPKGTYVLVGGDMLIKNAMWGSKALAKDQRLELVDQKAVKADLEYLASLMANGSLRAPIRATFDLDNITGAYRRLDEGHMQGKTVIQVVKAT